MYYILYVCIIELVYTKNQLKKKHNRYQSYPTKFNGIPKISDLSISAW